MMKSQIHYPKYQKTMKKDLILTKPQNFFSEDYIKLDKIIPFLEGKGLSEEYSNYFSFFLFIFLMTLTVPASLFPSHYTIFKNFISALGDYSKNPLGAYFFNNGMILLGLLQIPIHLFLYRIWKKESKNLALISCILSIVSSTGFIMVGIFPENIRIPHLFSAFLVFVGFLSVANIDLIILIKVRKFDRKFKKIYKLIELIYFIVYAVGTQFLFVTILNLFFHESYLRTYPFFSTSLWEWTSFIVLILWAISMFGYINWKINLDKKNLTPIILTKSH
ncbi:MAG: DUF998 domain-containing protein [Promethearchaeota archaeon]